MDLVNLNWPKENIFRGFCKNRAAEYVIFLNRFFLSSLYWDSPHDLYLTWGPDSSCQSLIIADSQFETRRVHLWNKSKTRYLYEWSVRSDRILQLIPASGEVARQCIKMSLIVTTRHEWRIFITSFPMLLFSEDHPGEASSEPRPLAPPSGLSSHVTENTILPNNVHHQKYLTRRKDCKIEPYIILWF